MIPSSGASPYHRGTHSRFVSRPLTLAPRNPTRSTDKWLDPASIARRIAQRRRVWETDASHPGGPRAPCMDGKSAPALTL